MLRLEESAAAREGGDGGGEVSAAALNVALSASLEEARGDLEAARQALGAREEELQRIKKIRSKE